MVVQTKKKGRNMRRYMDHATNARATDKIRGVCMERNLFIGKRLRACVAVRYSISGWLGNLHSRGRQAMAAAYAPSRDPAQAFSENEK
jgi:hypothetical protein